MEYLRTLRICHSMRVWIVSQPYTPTLSRLLEDVDELESCIWESLQGA